MKNEFFILYKFDITYSVPKAKIPVPLLVLNVMSHGTKLFFSLDDMACIPTALKAIQTLNHLPFAVKYL